MTTRSFDVKIKKAIEMLFEAIQELRGPPELPAAPERKIGLNLKEKLARWAEKGAGKIIRIDFKWLLWLKLLVMTFQI